MLEFSQIYLYFRIKIFIYNISLIIQVQKLFLPCKQLKSFQSVASEKETGPLLPLPLFNASEQEN